MSQTLTPTRFRPGAKGMIVHQGKILVVKEQIVSSTGTEIIYDFPGGGLDLGETVVEALHREIFEEVGLRVEVVKPVGSWDFFAHRPDDDEVVHLICVAFQCRVIGDALIDTNHNPADEDIFETQWLTIDEIKQLPKEVWLADVWQALDNVDLN